MAFRKYEATSQYVSCPSNVCVCVMGYPLIRFFIIWSSLVSTFLPTLSTVMVAIAAPRTNAVPHNIEPASDVSNSVLGIVLKLEKCL